MKTLIKILCLSLLNSYHTNIYDKPENPNALRYYYGGMMIKRGVKEFELAYYDYEEKFGKLNLINDTRLNTVKGKLNSKGMLLEIGFYNLENEPTKRNHFMYHKIIFTYDSNYNLIDESFYDISGSLINNKNEKEYSFSKPSKNIYKYDDKNRIISSLAYKKDGTICSQCFNFKVLYNYDDKGNLVNKKKYSRSDSTVVIYKYDEQNNLIEESNYDFEGNPIGDWNTEFRLILKYDKQNNLTEVTKYNIDGTKHNGHEVTGDCYKIIYRYNDDNLLEEKIKLDENDDYCQKQTSYFTNHYKYLYDSKSNESMQLQFLNDTLVRTIEKQYDKYNNQIELTAYTHEAKFGERTTTPVLKQRSTYKYQIDPFEGDIEKIKNFQESVGLEADGFWGELSQEAWEKAKEAELEAKKKELEKRRKEKKKKQRVIIDPID